MPRVVGPRSDLASVQVQGLLSYLLWKSTPFGWRRQLGRDHSLSLSGSLAFFASEGCPRWGPASMLLEWTRNETERPLGGGGAGQARPPPMLTLTGWRIFITQLQCQSLQKCEHLRSRSALRKGTGSGSIGESWVWGWCWQGRGWGGGELELALTRGEY
jgi:hypothetical protein